MLLGVGALATLVALPLGTAARVGHGGRRRGRLRGLPDVPARDAARRRGGRHRPHGEDRAGTYTGVWTAGETLGLAVGPFLYALVLTIGGYVSSTDAAAAQPDSARTAIALGFTVVPAVLVAASVVVLRRYRLDPKETG